MPSVQQVHITPEMILTMLIDQVTFSNVVSSTAEIGRSCCGPVYRLDDDFTVSPRVVVHCYRRLPSGVPCARTLHPVLVALYTFNGIHISVSIIAV